MDRGWRNKHNSGARGQAAMLCEISIMPVIATHRASDTTRPTGRQSHRAMSAFQGHLDIPGKGGQPLPVRRIRRLRVIPQALVKIEGLGQLRQLAACGIGKP